MDTKKHAKGAELKRKSFYGSGGWGLAGPGYDKKANEKACQQLEEWLAENPSVVVHTIDSNRGEAVVSINLWYTSG